MSAVPVLSIHLSKRIMDALHEKAGGTYQDYINAVLAEWVNDPRTLTAKPLYSVHTDGTTHVRPRMPSKTKKEFEKICIAIGVSNSNVANNLLAQALNVDLSQVKGTQRIELHPAASKQLRQIYEQNHSEESAPKESAGSAPEDGLIVRGTLGEYEKLTGRPIPTIEAIRRKLDGKPDRNR